MTSRGLGLLLVMMGLAGAAGFYARGLVPNGPEGPRSDVTENRISFVDSAKRSEDLLDAERKPAASECDEARMRERDGPAAQRPNAPEDLTLLEADLGGDFSRHEEALYNEEVMAAEAEADVDTPWLQEDDEALEEADSALLAEDELGVDEPRTDEELAFNEELLWDSDRETYEEDVLLPVDTDTGDGAD